MKTIIEIAQERGSAAKTRAGAWKYLLANLPKPNRGRTHGKWEEAAYLEARRNRTGDGRAAVLGYDINDPNTPGRIQDRAWADNRSWDSRCYRIVRDNYGALYMSHTPETRPDGAYWAALDIVAEADKRGLIPHAYDSIGWDRKGRSEGDAVHHELYDYRDGAALVCIRHSEGSRYGVKTTSKDYLLIERIEEDILSTATTLPIAKLAKTGCGFGAVIARVKGESDGAKLSAPAPETGYKALAVKEDGALCSIYSGEIYEIGKLKAEKACDGHNGGYYYYPTIEAACACEVPDSSRMLAAPRVIARCEVSGRRIAYGNGKIAATYLRPIEVVAAVLR